MLDLSNPVNNHEIPQEEPGQNSYLPPYLKQKITELSEISPYVFTNKKRIPITDWDPLVDSGRNNLNRVPDRTSSLGFEQWYIDTIIKNTALDVMEASQESPFAYKDIKYIDSYRYAKSWWKNETEFLDDKKR